jgi:PAS domain S-box-containing protein
MQRLVYALGGTGLLCLFCTIQLLLFHIPPSLPFFLVPTLIGSLGGLVLANRNQRINALNQQLRQTYDHLSTQYKESEERNQRLFQQGTTVQLLIDPTTGDLVAINTAARRFYGYTDEQQQPASIFDLNTDTVETTMANMQLALTLEQLTFHFHHRLRSGEVVPVEVYTIPVPLRGRMLLHSVVIDISHQDRAEHHLRRKTLEQRLLLDSIPVRIWYLKDAETFGSVNQAFAQSFHCTPQDIAHHRLQEILPTELLLQDLASNRQVFDEKQALHYEQWVHLDQAAPRYMAFTKTPKLDEQGQVEFVVCTATDITNTQQAKEMLRMERDLHVALTATHSLEESLQLCLTKAIDIAQGDCGGLYLVDDDDSLHLMAHQGLPAAFIEATSMYAKTSPQAVLVQRNQPLYVNCEELGQWIDTTLLHAEGIKAMAIVPIAFQDRVIASLNVASHQKHEIDSFSRMALERLMGHLGIFLIQKQQSAAILQSQHNLEALFNTISEFVFILDMQGRIIHVNAAVLSRLGYQAAELIGQHVLMVHPLCRHREAEGILADFFAGTTDLCPLPLLSRQGEEIPVETHLVRGEWNGTPVIFGMSRDIGERLQIERQQRMLLKNEGLERMAGAIAHHFNNLMAIVAGNVELAREETAKDSEAFVFLNNAVEGSDRAIALGRALLMYTGHFAEATVPLDLGELCRTTLRNLSPPLPPTLSLEHNIAAVGPMVVANPQQLQQVLGALLTNAVETMGERLGTLTIQVASLAAADIPAGHLFPTGWTPVHQRYGYLKVGDSGSGIDEQQMASIFDPFYSDKFIGRGLGLPIALSIVKKLEGAICVSSRPSSGSTFHVLLPESESV